MYLGAAEPIGIIARQCLQTSRFRVDHSPHGTAWYDIECALTAYQSSHLVYDSWATTASWPKSLATCHAWRPVDPQMQLFGGFDFFTPLQPPARDGSSDVRVEAWR